MSQNPGHVNFNSGVPLCSCLGCKPSLKALTSMADLDQCSSVGRVLSHKAKGRRFNSWSGHMAGLQVRCLVRALTRDSRLMFLPHIDVSLPFAFPHFPSLKISK